MPQTSGGSRGQRGNGCKSPSPTSPGKGGYIPPVQYWPGVIDRIIPQNCSCCQNIIIIIIEYFVKNKQKWGKLGLFKYMYCLFLCPFGCHLYDSRDILIGCAPVTCVVGNGYTVDVLLQNALILQSLILTV